MQLPDEFKDKYRQLLGKTEAVSFLASFSQPVHHGFRINPLKAALPVDVDLSQPLAHCRFGYAGDISGKTVAHQSGAVYSQEPSAMYVGEVAAPKHHERVLDLCAAPGGKTTHIGSYLANTGLLIANEIDHQRAKVLMENVERFGLKNTIVTNSTPAIIARQLPEFFDRILVDAPCSGEGMFRKDPDAISYWNLDYPKQCAERQRQILSEAVKSLKPGGELIYSTCTFAPEEDEQIVAWLNDQYHFEILPIAKASGMDAGRPDWADRNPALTNCVRIFPHHFNGEGHFIAKLRKPAADGPLSTMTKRPKKNRRLKAHSNWSPLSSEQQQLWQKFSADMFQSLSIGQLHLFKETLYAVPSETPSLGPIKVVRGGLQLGTFKKKRFEPSYALALAVQPSEAKRRLTISLADWRRYVHGDTFAVDPQLEKGWYLLVCQGQSVGFSKIVNGTAKNFFPKGLRFQVNN